MTETSWRPTACGRCRAIASTNAAERLGSRCAEDLGARQERADCRGIRVANRDDERPTSVRRMFCVIRTRRSAPALRRALTAAAADRARWRGCRYRQGRREAPTTTGAHAWVPFLRGWSMLAVRDERLAERPVNSRSQDHRDGPSRSLHAAASSAPPSAGGPVSFPACHVTPVAGSAAPGRRRLGRAPGGLRSDAEPAQSSSPGSRGSYAASVPAPSVRRAAPGRHVQHQVRPRDRARHRGARATARGRRRPDAAGDGRPGSGSHRTGAGTQLRLLPGHRAPRSGKYWAAVRHAG
jgi:hypothetical protein